MKSEIDKKIKSLKKLILDKDVNIDNKDIIKKSRGRPPKISNNTDVVEEIKKPNNRVQLAYGKFLIEF